MNDNEFNDFIKNFYDDEFEMERKMFLLTEKNRRDNEDQLHKKVVKYIREKYPNLLIDAGLGEYQDTEEKGIDAWQ